MYRADFSEGRVGRFSATAHGQLFIGSTVAEVMGRIDEYEEFHAIPVGASYIVNDADGRDVLEGVADAVAYERGTEL